MLHYTPVVVNRKLQPAVPNLMNDQFSIIPRLTRASGREQAFKSDNARLR